VKRYLLDTHLIYWWMTANPRLGEAARRIIESAEIIISTTSLWEMVLKNAKGKLPLPDGSLTDAFEQQGFILLPVLPRHVEAARHLDCPHPDPFDRLLIAQARDECMPLLTCDSALLALGINGILPG
jgi:PIN domain nuclease of toxin-antitoxin system